MTIWSRYASYLIRGMRMSACPQKRRRRIRAKTLLLLQCSACDASDSVIKAAMMGCAGPLAQKSAAIYCVSPRNGAGP